MINQNVYSEVYEILSYMDKSVVMKIPIDILEKIKEKRNKDYISRIDKNDIFNKNNVDKKTIEVLAWLDVNYWIDQDKKNKLQQCYIEKIKNEELQKQERYSNGVFNNKKEENKLSEKVEINLIENKEDSFIIKIKKWILNFF